MLRSMFSSSHANIFILLSEVEHICGWTPHGCLGPRACAPSHGALVKGEGLVKLTKLDREKVLTTWMTQFFIRNQSEVKERYYTGGLG